MGKNISNAVWLMGLCLAVVDCGGKTNPDESSGMKPSPLEEFEYLLVKPQGRAASLLGLPVTIKPARGFEIGKARIPGCRVTPHAPTSSKWTQTYHQETDTVAGFLRDFGTVAELEAKHRQGVGIEAVITNEQELTADLSGPCGYMAIKSVKIGTGRFEFQYKKIVASGTSADEESAADAGMSYWWETTGKGLIWQAPLVWAVTIAVSAGVKQGELSVRMPPRITTGQRYSPEITVGDRDLWLIVVSCDENDKCWVLQPTPINEVRVTPAQQTLVLAAIRASAPTRERLIVYGFPEEPDFKRFSPPANNLTEAAATAYVKELNNRLEKKKEIETKRWIKAEFAYVIEAGEKKSDETSDE